MNSVDVTKVFFARSARLLRLPTGLGDGRIGVARGDVDLPNARAGLVKFAPFLARAGCGVLSLAGLGASSWSDLGVLVGMTVVVGLGVLLVYQLERALASD